MMPFTPTHRVPAGGMDSWPRPDAQAPRGPRINEALVVQSTDRLGDWAKVVFDNGWSAWVDGRLLEPVLGTRKNTTPGPGSGRAFDLAAIRSDRTRVAGLGGALLVALASVLPWLRGTGQSVNSYDVRAKVLIDYKSNATSGLTIGVILLLLSAALVVAIAVGRKERLTQWLGVATIGVPGLYVVQLQRALSNVPGAGITDFIGIGILAAVAGGALVLIAPRLTEKSV